LIDGCFGFLGNAQFLRMPIKHSIEQVANDQATDKATTQGKNRVLKHGLNKIACCHARNERNQESGQAEDGCKQ
jgi:hypothetical protein